MFVDIDKKLIEDYRKFVRWDSYEKTDSEILNTLLRRELYKLGEDGYHKDPLTKCFSRPRLCKDILDVSRQIKRGISTLFYNTIICIDIRNVKRINDYKGLSEGDRVIQKTGHFLIDLFNTDRVYRTGGEEFAVVSFNEYTTIPERCCQFEPTLKFTIITLSVSITPESNIAALRDHVLDSIDEGMSQAQERPTMLTLTF